MSLTQKVAHNTLVQIVGKAISTLLGLIVIAMIGRYLGPEGFGQYTTVTIYLQFFGILVDFGLVLVTVQMISEHKADEQRIIKNLFTLRFFSALIFLALAPMIAALFTDYSPLVQKGILLSTLSFFFIALNQILTGLFQKHLSLIWVVLSENIGRVVLLVGTIIAIWLDRGLMAVLFAVVLGSFIQFLVMLLGSRRYVRVGFAFEWSVWKDILRRSWPIGVSIAFNLIYLRADTLIIKQYFDDTTVGLYGAAYRVLDIVLMLPVMMMGVILPILTNAWSEGNREKFSRGLQKTFNVFMMLIVPIVAGTWIVGNDIMGFVMGDAFRAAGPVLFILVIGLFGAFVSTLFGHTTVAIGHQKKVIWVYAVDAVLSLAAYLVFIPRYGMAGGAWVTVFSEWLAALLLAWYVLRFTRLHIALGTLGKVMLASFLMLVIMSLTPPMHVLLLILWAAIVYAGFLALFGVLNRSFIRSLLKKSAS